VTHSATQHKTVTYYVNGEKQATKQDKLTVREILTAAGFTIAIALIVFSPIPRLRDLPAKVTVPESVGAR